ncbi:hypothetical protein FHX42_002985 [Saccharopolyspora lacisalsi]|uniref:TROVE domain-containing protein n=1 Tax=Halosaccharopolyspora lacisalsi TaxID=1000566 RepID=A0A839DY11_9PSEU|nr:hypothetical protein [Halosaccharopolyspora lacisalsi]
MNVIHRTVSTVRRADVFSTVTFGVIQKSFRGLNFTSSRAFPVAWLLAEVALHSFEGLRSEVSMSSPALDVAPRLS